MRDVFWTSSGLSDLIDILEWIAHDEPAAARDVVARLEAAGEALGFMATGRKGRVPGTYEKVVTGLPWIVVYSISKEPHGREKIVILRVIHGRRDWPPRTTPTQ